MELSLFFCASSIYGNYSLNWVILDTSFSISSYASHKDSFVLLGATTHTELAADCQTVHLTNSEFRSDTFSVCRLFSFNPSFPWPWRSQSSMLGFSYFSGFRTRDLWKARVWRWPLYHSKLEVIWIGIEIELNSVTIVINYLLGKGVIILLYIYLSQKLGTFYLKKYFLGVIYFKFNQVLSFIKWHLIDNSNL